MGVGVYLQNHTLNHSLLLPSPKLPTAALSIKKDYLLHQKGLRKCILGGPLCAGGGGVSSVFPKCIPAATPLLVRWGLMTHTQQSCFPNWNNIEKQEHLTFEQRLEINMFFKLHHR